MNRYIVPTAAAGGVVVLGALLILVMTLRPWGGPDRGFDTHLNLADAVPADYSRTEVTLVGDAEMAPVGWKLADESSDTGLSLYVARGCAGCHGLDGAGTFSGPDLRGGSLRRVTKLTRDGNGGMPNYHESDLTDSELGLIFEFLESLGPAPVVLVPEPEPSPTPWPSPTPFPLPTPVASPIPTASPTPILGLADSDDAHPQDDDPVKIDMPSEEQATPAALPTDTPEPTPTATPAPRLTEEESGEARRLFIDVGCDLCHGLDAEGTEKGPELTGFAATDIRDSVRDGIVNPESEYTREMEPYTLDDLTAAELDLLVDYLLDRDLLKGEE